MVLSEEDKRRIKDFILDKSTVDPTELILQEDKDEALEYARFCYESKNVESNV